MQMHSSAITAMNQPQETQLSTHDDAVLLSTLPREAWIGTIDLVLCQGFWCPSFALNSVISFQRNFQANDSDIIIASKPKSGTTWMKALVYSIVSRSHFTTSTSPLLTSGPHDLVPFLEFNLYAKNELPDLSSIPSPRLFATHVPYKYMPESTKNSNCRIIYICRNPLDNLVSAWHFFTKTHPNILGEMAIEEVVEIFCKGVDVFGPYWEHLLGYWKESQEKPRKVMFLMYEDLKMNPVLHLKKIAEFIGLPFSLEEEREGVIESIAKLCSFGKMKDLEVNKTGNSMGLWENKLFLREGKVGDSVNYLSATVVERVEKLMEEKLGGSGLTLRFPTRENFSD
jgi:hydroxyjasmonate sulfotransferase